MTSSPSGESRWGWRLLGAVVTVALGFGAALVAANIMLDRALASLGGGHFEVSARRSWTWAPSRIRLSDVRVAHPRSGWIVSAHSVEGELALYQLLRGRLVLRELRARLQAATLDDPLFGELLGGDAALLEFVGGMELHASSVRHQRGEWTVAEARLVFDGSALAVENQARAIVRGDVVLLPELGRARVRLRGAAAADAPPLWSLVGRVGRSLAEPFEVELRSIGEWSWRAGQAMLRISPRSKCTLRGTAGGVDIGVEVPRLVVTTESERISTAIFDVLRVDYREPAPLPGSAPVRLDAVRVVADGMELETSILGHIRSPVDATGDLRRTTERSWILHSAEVHLPALQAARSPGASSRLSLRAFAEGRPREDGAKQLRGSVSVSGPRLETLFELFSLPEPATLLLSPFTAEPFEAHARLLAEPGNLLIDDITLASARTHARGFVHRRATNMNGALVVEVPLGTVGLTLGEASNAPVFNPPNDWLRRRLHEETRSSLQ